MSSQFCEDEKRSEHDHGGSLHEMTNKRSPFHHHGANGSIAEREREPKSSETSARQPMRYGANLSNGSKAAGGIAIISCRLR